MSRTIVGAADPNEPQWVGEQGSTTADWFTYPVGSTTAQPWLREVRDDTVPLTGWMGSGLNHSRSHEMVPPFVNSAAAFYPPLTVTPTNTTGAVPMSYMIRTYP